MQITALQAPDSFCTKMQGIAQRLAASRVYDRIIQRDHTLWRPEPDEIANRLGWLDSPHLMRSEISQIYSVISQVRDAGYTHALLLGMGGSSLAPEVLRTIFGVADGFLDLSVLDSTHPDAILAKTRALDPARTLFLPATKSGSTVETLSLLKYFFNHTVDSLGQDAASQRFAAITDPGSSLETLARKLNFRHIFRNDPNIGGRYSALSFFGLVAAGAIGMDLERLLDRAQDALEDPQPGIQLGTFLAAGLLTGFDKLTLIASPSLSAAGAWIEQLVAESTGKDGKGLVPIDLEPETAIDRYGTDRLFAYLRYDEIYDSRVQAIVDAGYPVQRLDICNPYDLGAVFFHWEIATVIAGYFLAIHPFDQPNVEAAKILTRKMVDTYQQQSQLPTQDPDLVADGLEIYGDLKANTLVEALMGFLAKGTPNRSYIALQAYLPTTPSITEALQDLRCRLLEYTGLATTMGFGPRFLHSTGQLHKGDGGHGLFLQLTANAKEDAPIPDAAGAKKSGIGFDILAQAQALGDHQALINQNRAVLRIHLGEDIGEGLAQLSRTLELSQPAQRRH